MGFLRTLYREVRDIIGMSPPPENDTQRAERVCGEIKDQIGGKRAKQGDDYTLATNVDGRDVRVLFEAAGSRAIIEVGTALPADREWFVEADALDPGSAPAPSAHRTSVASGVYVAGDTEREAERALALWKQLPTGARGVFGPLMGKARGRVEVEGPVLRYVPEGPTLADKSAKYAIKTQIQQLTKIADGVEQSWG